MRPFSGRRLELEVNDSREGFIHCPEHSRHGCLELLKLSRGWLIAPLRKTDLQLAQSAFESALAPMFPEEIAKIIVHFGAPEQVLECLDSEPAAPVTAEAGAEQQDMRHLYASAPS